MFCFLYLLFCFILLPALATILKVRKTKMSGDIISSNSISESDFTRQINIETVNLNNIWNERNDLKVKEEFNFKQSAKDILITSQLRTALILNKNIKATNYQIDTYKKKIYLYGISITLDEKEEVINEAEQILDVEDVIASILLVEDLRIQKN